MTRIALDAMGGDYAPRQIVVGAVEAACEIPDVKILLVGQLAAIQKEIDGFSKDRRALAQRASSPDSARVYASTAITLRPLYVPHFGHARCERFAAPHAGQVDTDAKIGFSSEATRWRLRIFDTRFLGLAMSVLLVLAVFCHFESLRNLQSVQRAPAVVVRPLDLLLDARAGRVAERVVR